MNLQEAQRIVRATYPRAVDNQQSITIPIWNVWADYQSPRSRLLLGTGDTKESAWIDSANKLNRMKP